MPHRLEPAKSGRAKCRGCGRRIDKGSLRFGECLPNPYDEDGDSEQVLWFHLACGAYKRPEPFLLVLAEHPQLAPEHLAPEHKERLQAIARAGVAHPRMARIVRVERAPTGRALCRKCRVAIAKQGWRVVLDFFEDGRFNPAGFLHPRCAAGYFGSNTIMDRLEHFTPELDEVDRAELQAELRAEG